MIKGKILIGKVIAAKNLKTLTVLVETTYRNPKYGKVMRRRKKYLVHDEKGVPINSKVKIRETRPISKRKHFIVEEVLQKMVQSPKSKLKNR